MTLHVALRYIDSFDRVYMPCSVIRSRSMSSRTKNITALAARKIIVSAARGLIHVSCSLLV